MWILLSGLGMVVATAAAHVQGLTLVHFFAQRKRFV
jgi:hypothetical protein